MPDFAALVRAILGPAWSFVRGWSGSSSGTDTVNAPGHHGWDISAKLGTPVPSFTGGTVVYAEDARRNVSKASQWWTTGGGNVVIVKGTDGREYHYAHLNKIAVSVGDAVSPGKVLGEVGSTGDSTGPHLHFAIVDRARKLWVDPKQFMASLGKIDLIGFLPNGNLPGFNFMVDFPVGHVLTMADIDNIVNKMNGAGWFNPNSGSPIADELGQVKARNAVHETLKQFVGREWTPSLLLEMSQAIGLKAETVDDNPLAGVGEALGAIATILATVFNPANWLKIGGLLLGLFLIYTGFRSLMDAASTSTVSAPSITQA